MPHIFDLGGAPANEECAQLGQTIDFEAANTLEVMTYKLAIIARHVSTYLSTLGFGQWIR
mgnify:CR=1 FL=1